MHIAKAGYYKAVAVIRYFPAVFAQYLFDIAVPYDQITILFNGKLTRIYRMYDIAFNILTDI